MGHVVILEEESLLARVVGALAKGGRLPARVVPRQVAVFIEIEFLENSCNLSWVGQVRPVDSCGQVRNIAPSSK